MGTTSVPVARLEPSRQTLLVPAHLRNDDTHARLAVGFGISRSTAWRYVREAVDLADDLLAVRERTACLAHTRLD